MIIMLQKTHLLLAAILLPWLVTAQSLDFPNAGFEQGFEHWTVTENDKGMSSVSSEIVRSGSYALKVLDEDPVDGSWLMGPIIPCAGSAKLIIKGWHYPVSGAGLGLYLRQFDQDGQRIPGEDHVRGLSGSQQRWLPFMVASFLGERTHSVQLYFHSYSHARVHAYIDDLSLERQPYASTPPWPPQYKIKADESHRFTAADLLGPDGIVYPDWRRCGVEGGIPRVAAKLRLRDFGAQVDDDEDDSVALVAACAALPPEGGAIILDAGTYHFDRPVTISRDDVVIRGQGMGKTKIIFRYGLDASGIQFYSPSANAQVGPHSRVEIHALPTNLETMSITAGNKTLMRWAVSTHSGNSFATGISGAAILKQFPEGGPLLLEGTATYKDGTTRRCSLPIVLNPQRGEAPPPSIRAAILFQGKGLSRTRSLLSADGKRGDTSIDVVDGSAFAAGDQVIIEGPATARWKALTENACRWGSYRKNALRIKAVNGNSIQLEQPLRIEFPVIDGSYIQKQQPIQRCGVESLTIEQTENLWITAVLFSHAWNCWATDVEVIKCGRFPVYGNQAKFCELRNMVFRDAWFKGGGGTAYAGWEHCWDCLIDGIETHAYRHAPLFQWSASGCVIRNGVFYDSDAQWHSGWTNENLMENCVVYSSNDNGAYGFGMWASPPEDDAHGPNGPRNVVYNCDVFSPKAGLWLGGMNENWLILNNRFTVEKGPGFFTRNMSFDHIIAGNVFVIKDDRSAAIQVFTPDCFGIEVYDNRVFGGTISDEGTGVPRINARNNVFFPLDEQQRGSRPRPAVPSIFDWQRQQSRR
jgi:hypothetical protein